MAVKLARPSESPALSPVAIAVLAITMSADSFAAAVGRGAARQAPGRAPMREALTTGLVFGLIEALTPVIGWAAGMVASRHVAVIDHWIAFALLCGVGLHTAHGALFPAPERRPSRASPWPLVATAVGTSLDAMAVGVSLAVLNADIVTIAAAIGLATFLLSSGGVLVGRMLGDRFGRLAELAAGVLLCGLGVVILIEHLTAG